VLTFSIVIPTFNRRDMVLEAIASARAQDWNAVEIIVIDGGSTDGTQEVVSREPSIRLISEPDRGVYDALNKGIAAATGEIVGLLNSDDRYEPGIFSRVAAAFEANPQAGSVCGSARVVEGQRLVQVIEREEDKHLTPRAALIGNCIPNARFFRRTGRSVQSRLPLRGRPRLADPLARSRISDGRNPGRRLHLWPAPRLADLRRGAPARLCHPRGTAGTGPALASQSIGERENAPDCRRARRPLPRNPRLRRLAHRR
jgi:glycosyltransferase involved in cell wall biosynthesis